MPAAPFTPSHPETRSKRSRFEVSYELCDRRQKGFLLVSRERIEVGAKAGQPGKGGHAFSASTPRPPWSFCPTPQGRKELLAGAEYFQTIAGKIRVRFPLPLLPLLCPKRRLGGVDDLLRPEQNPLVRNLGIEEIAFFRAQRRGSPREASVVLWLSVWFSTQSQPSQISDYRIVRFSESFQHKVVEGRSRPDGLGLTSSFDGTPSRA